MTSSCHSNDAILAAVFFGVLPKSFTGAFFSNSCVDVREVLGEMYELSVIEISWDEVYY